MGVGDWTGDVVEIYDAPWWQLGRWWSYWVRTPRRDRFRVEFGTAHSPARSYRCRYVRRSVVEVVRWDDEP
jgi:hypothetical protein